MAKSSGSGTRGRSTNTGRFVTKGTVSRNPSQTVTERIGGKSTNGANRSGSSGRFVSKTTAARNPKGTMKDS